MKAMVSDKRLYNDRKAQIEIIGLLIIVILVTIIILLVITFGIKQPSGPTTTQQVSDNQIATLFFPTILETTTTCDRTVRELLADCAYTNEIMCGAKNSCTFANETLIDVLNRTLSSYGYSYAVKVWKTNPDVVFTQNIILYRKDLAAS